MYKTISKTIKQLRKQFNNIPTIFSCVPSTAVLKSIQLFSVALKAAAKLLQIRGGKPVLGVVA